MRSARSHRVVVQYWTLKDIIDCTLDIDAYFMASFILKRAKKYAASVQSRLHLECTARTLPEGKCAYAALFLQPVVEKTAECTNHRKRLEHTKRKSLSHAGMYFFLAVIF